MSSARYHPFTGVLQLENAVQKAKQAWEAVLGDLQLRVTRPSYETWLKGTVGIAHADGEFVVGTPNAFVAEMPGTAHVLAYLPGP